MALKVSVVVGNPRSGSRTRDVGVALVESLLASQPYDLEVIELADHVDEIFDWKSVRVTALNDLVAASDLAIFASPTYKATYTGVLKAFLDRYPSEGLSGVVAIPVHTGADLGHSMGPTVNLAPLLAELGAVVPGKGFYFVTGDMDDLQRAAEHAANTYRTNIAAVARLAP
ncbi:MULTISPECIES: NAD(P)H-dependent oxidoreductase [unclassified Microbacterium]|uniref:NADPH-dependent FMN reductase n=1 Tax=unclassified Microbacterium TaxID=2609290 RepID=UPI00214C96F4|nr:MULTISPECIES: NAD(P)H-dependent oxidoreductase [unclassified Microbacterium]MCR2808413.1 NAD(P)H-dependent oxidoreductase [Microbacterium sp. zg.B185]WIM19142.1 NAD(P)H-dependent oxidoreductase [Microbacterium sp. zg-B185]